MNFHPSLLLKQAQQHFNSNNYQAAIQVYTSLIQSSLQPTVNNDDTQNHLTALYNRGTIHYIMTQYQLAVDDIGKCMEGWRIRVSRDSQGENNRQPNQMVNINPPNNLPVVFCRCLLKLKLTIGLPSRAIELLEWALGLFKQDNRLVEQVRRLMRERRVVVNGVTEEEEQEEKEEEEGEDEDKPNKIQQGNPSQIPNQSPSQQQQFDQSIHPLLTPALTKLLSSPFRPLLTDQSLLTKIQMFIRCPEIAGRLIKADSRMEGIVDILGDGEGAIGGWWNQGKKGNKEDNQGQQSCQLTNEQMQKHIRSIRDIQVLIRINQDICYQYANSDLRTNKK